VSLRTGRTTFAVLRARGPHCPGNLLLASIYVYPQGRWGSIEYLVSWMENWGGLQGKAWVPDTVDGGAPVVILACPSYNSEGRPQQVLYCTAIISTTRKLNS